MSADQINTVASWTSVLSVAVGFVASWVRFARSRITDKTDRRLEWARVSSLAVGLIAACTVVASGGIRNRSEMNAISRADQQAARAERDAVEARLSLARFKAVRRLSNDQVRHVKQLLLSFGRMPVAVYGYGNDLEDNLASQLSQVLNDAGWRATKWRETGVPLFVGVRVIVQPSVDTNVRQAAEAGPTS